MLHEAGPDAHGDVEGLHPVRGGEGGLGGGPGGVPEFVEVGDSQRGVGIQRDGGDLKLLVPQAGGVEGLSARQEVVSRPRDGQIVVIAAGAAAGPHAAAGSALSAAGPLPYQQQR